MSYTPHRKIADAIRSLVPFKGNSSWAVRSTGAAKSSYSVWSYSTKIFEIFFDTNGNKTLIEFNNSAYSRTTSKLQNLIINSVLASPASPHLVKWLPSYRRDNALYIWDSQGKIVSKDDISEEDQEEKVPDSRVIIIPVEQIL